MATDMASRALRGGRENVVDEGASRLLAAKVAGVFQRAATWVRGASEVAARELESVEALGELFLKQGEVGEAIAVFTSLSAGICAYYETIWDKESEVGRILDACVDGLEGCLDAVEVDARGDILGALLDIAVWERMSGGYGIGERAAEVLLGRCDAGERRALDAATAFVLERATLDSGARQRLGSFAVQLGGGADEERAALLRETGDEQRRIARLLALHEPRARPWCWPSSKIGPNWAPGPWCERSGPWKLKAIAAQGENCLKRGEVGEAVALLSTLGAGICAGYEKIWDEESEVGRGLRRRRTSSRASPRTVDGRGEAGNRGGGGVRAAAGGAPRVRSPAPRGLHRPAIRRCGG